MSLLPRARAAGLRAWAAEGRLALEGPAALGPLALELLAAEAEVLAELEAEALRPGPFALLPEGADPERPPWGWCFVRVGPLAGTWIGPEGAWAPGPPRAGPEHGIANGQSKR